MFEDPVCKMMVDERRTPHVSEVEERKVFLCSAHCKSEFDKNPAKYGYYLNLAAPVTLVLT